MVQRNKFLVLLMGLWVSAVVEAAGPEYALPELERLALDSSSSMMAAREQVTAARYAVRSAGAFPNPEIEYLAGTARSRAAGGNSGEARSATLTQPIDLPWVRSSRIGAAEAGVQASEAGLRAFEADLLASVRVRYFEVLRRNAELRNAREDLGLMEGVRSRIALRVETGEAPRFELVKADAEMLNAQKTVQAAGFRAEQARSHLRQSVGPGLPAEYALRGSLRDVPDVLPLDSDAGAGQGRGGARRAAIGTGTPAALAQFGGEGRLRRRSGYADFAPRRGGDGAPVGPP